jgi:ketosteroid isomerase-like protein
MIRMDSFDVMMAALKFNEKINEQDLEGLAELMTDDHTFVDSSGDITKGKDVMKEVWRKFFEQCPDYRNIFTSVTVKNNVVVMVGYSTCSYKLLNGSSMWTAKVSDGRISEWRVYWLDQDRK